MMGLSGDALDDGSRPHGLEILQKHSRIREVWRTHGIWGRCVNGQPAKHALGSFVKLLVSQLLVKGD